jgi:hypothetical protein
MTGYEEPACATCRTRWPPPEADRAARLANHTAGRAPGHRTAYWCIPPKRPPRHRKRLEHVDLALDEASLAALPTMIRTT